MPGSVVSIHIAPVAEAPMRAVDLATAVEGRGIEGDRYFLGTGTSSHKPDPSRQITLIEIEAVEGAAREHKIDLTACESRRNIVTRGVALNHLVGCEFTVGSATLRGLRLCEPCNHLEKLTRPGVMKSLIHRGGLRAQVVRSGEIRPGDAIVPVRASAVAATT
jgi:MOSC domain-containing protein YiiM